MRILLLSLSLAAAVTAMAQANAQEQAFQQRAEQVTEQLTGKLGLDEAQTTKLNETNFAYFRHLEHIQTQVPEEFRQPRIDEIERVREDSYRAILTEEQYQRFEKFRDGKDLR